MEYRELGRMGWKVSAIRFGAWAIGAAWGNVVDGETMAALNRALDPDIFSCAPYLPETAATYAAEYFKAARYSLHAVERR